MPLKGFLHYELARIRGASVTVLNLIKYFAHVFGAVHAGTPENDAERSLATLHDSAVEEERRWPDQALRAVCLAALDALGPLRSYALGVHRFDDAPGVTLYTSLALQSLGGDRDNVIVDIGTDRKRDRLTVFVDADDRIVVRQFDGAGKRLQVRSAAAPLGFRYGEVTTLGVSLGWRAEPSPHMSA